jgi:hypothetical protein
VGLSAFPPFLVVGSARLNFTIASAALLDTISVIIAINSLMAAAPFVTSVSAKAFVLEGDDSFWVVSSGGSTLIVWSAADG